MLVSYQQTQRGNTGDSAAHKCKFSRLIFCVFFTLCATLGWSQQTLPTTNDMPVTFNGGTNDGTNDGTTKSGQIWYLTPTMTATLDEGTGELTIATTHATGEAMPSTMDPPIMSNLYWYADGKENDILSVVIDDKVTTIGGGMFLGCTNLAAVTIPNSVTEIGYSAFHGCKITSLTIPKSVTNIGPGALMLCPLSDVTVSWDTPLNIAPPGVGMNPVFLTTDVASATLHVPAGTQSAYEGDPWWGAFGTIDEVVTNSDQVWNLTPTMTATLTQAGVLTISTTVASEAMPDFNWNSSPPVIAPWSAPAFSDQVHSVVIENNVISVGQFAFRESQNLTSVTISNSVTSIGSAAFSNCPSLSSIVIPNSVTTIYNNAFAGSGLTSIMIPQSVTYIGVFVFYYCTDLTSIQVDSNNPNYSSDDGVLYNKNKTVLCAYPVGKNGSFSIPNTVITIVNGAFSACTGLSSVTIPNSVITIDVSGFSECTGLTSITIPNSVTTIGDAAFSWCLNLTEMTVNWSIPLNLPNNIFDGINLSNFTLHVPAGTKSAYQADPVWGSFAFGTIDDGVTNGDQVWNLTATMKATLNSAGVLTISTNLPSEAMPDYNVSVPWDAVKNNILSVIITSGITRISSFYGCNNVTSVTIPNTVKTIGDHAFANCSSLPSITIPNGVESIDWASFFGCTSLTSIYIPESVIDLGGGPTFACEVFLRCSKLSSIQVADNNPNYSSQDGVLYNKNKTALLCYPAGKAYSSFAATVNRIERVAFHGNKMSSIDIPGSVNSIGDNAFTECTNLESVILPVSVNAIGQYCFSDCVNLRDITVHWTNPAGVTVDPDAFSGTNTSLITLHVPAGAKAQYQSDPFWGSLGFGTIDDGTSNYSLSVSLNSLSFTAPGEQKTFAVTSNTDWTVSSDESWATVSPASGSNNGTVTVTTGANTTTSQRTATITVSGTGVTSQTVSVTQAASTTPPGGKTWNLTATMTATLNSAGVLTISTTAPSEAMPDYSNSTSRPWHDERLNISSVVIDDKVTAIGSYAFSQCPNLTSVTLPNSVQTIGRYAFANCNSLNAITFPISVTSIGSDAFQGCNFSAVTIPASVTSIEASAFRSCGNLVSIEVDPANMVYSSEAGVVYNKNKTTVVMCPPGKSGAFRIPNTVTIIGASAFDNCEGLTYVTIPNSVTTIEMSAFRSCNGLSAVTIPMSVTFIDIQAFQHCSVLKDVTVEWTTPLSLSTTPFYGNQQNMTLHVPRGTKELYEADPYWGTFWYIEDGTFLTADPLTLNFSAYSSEEKPLTVTSNTTWELSVNQNWITASRGNGSNNATVYIGVRPNTTNSQRTGEIYIKAESFDMTRTIKITQEAATQTLQLDVSQTTLNFNAESEQQTFDITANVDWRVRSSVGWLSVDPATGRNNQQITVKSEKNSNANTRSGSITVNGLINDEIVITKTISVMQAAGTGTEAGATYTASPTATECVSQTQITAGGVVYRRGYTTISASISGNTATFTLSTCNANGAIPEKSNIQLRESSSSSLATVLQGSTVRTVSNSSQVHSYKFTYPLTFNSGTRYYSVVVDGAAILCSEVIGITAGGGNAGTPVNDPVLSLTGISNETMTTATVNGFVNPQGSVTAYCIQYSTTPSFSNAKQTDSKNVGSGNSNVTFSEPLKGLDPSSPHYVRIKASNTSLQYFYSNVLTLNAKGVSGETPANQPPIKPNSPVPNDGALNVSTSTTLSWYTFDPEGGSVGFNIYYGLSTSAMTLIEGNGMSQYISGLQPGKKYYWKVIAYDNQDAPSASDVWSFTTSSTTGAPTPSKPSNPSPAHRAEGVPTSPVLSWYTDNPESSYKLYLGTSLGNMTQRATGTGTLQSLSGLSGKYYWQVEVSNGTSASVKSDIWEFTTQSVNSLYKLPFACGATFTCSQGNNGSFSHSSKEQYAFDFHMNQGTKVLAARAGEVTHVTQNFTQNFIPDPNNGCSELEKNSVNRVVIKHGDGTSALYLHLAYNSALVKVGDYVSQGQEIASSGNTGCSTNPHLHFMVMHTGSSWHNQSIPCSFADVPDNGGVPVEGRSYTSGNCQVVSNTVLSLASPMTFKVSGQPTTTLTTGKAHTFTTAVTNTGNTSWTGTFYLYKIENGVESQVYPWTITIPAGQPATLTWDKDGGYNPQTTGKKQFVLYYKTNSVGNLQPVLANNFANPITVNIEDPAKNLSINLSATNDNGTVYLSWNSVPGAQLYTLYREYNGNGNNKNVSTETSTANPATFYKTDLPGDGNYTYYVMAKLISGTTIPSNTQTVKVTASARKTGTLNVQLLNKEDGTRIDNVTIRLSHDGSTHTFNGAKNITGIPIGSNGSITVTKANYEKFEHKKLGTNQDIYVTPINYSITEQKPDVGMTIVGTPVSSSTVAQKNDLRLYKSMDIDKNPIPTGIAQSFTVTLKNESDKTWTGQLRFISYDASGSSNVNRESILPPLWRSIDPTVNNGIKEVTFAMTFSGNNKMFAVEALKDGEKEWKIVDKYIFKNPVTLTFKKEEVKDYNKELKKDLSTFHEKAIESGFLTANNTILTTVESAIEAEFKNIGQGIEIAYGDFIKYLEGLQTEMKKDMGTPQGWLNIMKKFNDKAGGDLSSIFSAYFDTGVALANKLSDMLQGQNNTYFDAAIGNSQNLKLYIKVNSYDGNEINNEIALIKLRYRTKSYMPSGIWGEWKYGTRSIYYDGPYSLGSNKYASYSTNANFGAPSGDHVEILFEIHWKNGKIINVPSGNIGNNRDFTIEFSTTSGKYEKMADKIEYVK